MHSALQCMHSNDFLSAILNNVSSDGQHQMTNSYRHVAGRTGLGLTTRIVPMPLSFGKTPMCSWHISQNTCDISHRESGTNSEKGTKVPCKEQKSLQGHCFVLCRGTPEERGQEELFLLPVAPAERRDLLGPRPHTEFLPLRIGRKQRQIFTLT